MPLVEIGKYLNMTTVNLLHIFKVSASDKWTIQFKGEAPIIHTVPRLLDDVIQKLHEKIEFNRRNNRRDIVNKFVLSGFVRCEKCNSLFSGRSQRYLVNGSQYNYISYYAHITKPRSACDGISTKRLEKLEQAVFETIFENIGDEPRFQKAIKDSLPDFKMIKDLKNKIKDGEVRLKKIQKDIDKLADALLDGILTKDTLKKKERDLLDEKASINKTLENDRNHLDSLPDIDEVKTKADKIRQ